MRCGAKLQFHEVTKTFGGDELVIGDLNFSIEPGEIRAIVGRSGVGKTTLLRLAGGLERPDSGTVLIDGSSLKAVAARLGVVVQDYSSSLLPWLRVDSNLELALRHSEISPRKWSNQVDEYLDLVGLGDVREKYPWQLSGGMQQRIALARALIAEPRLILLDEPFASVDAITRMELQGLTWQLLKESNATTILVTHDIGEAVFMGDHVSVLDRVVHGFRETFRIDINAPRDILHTRATRAFHGYVEEITELISLAS